MNSNQFNPADPATLIALNAEVETLKGTNQILEGEISNTQTSLEKVSKKANSKSGLVLGIIAFVLLMTISVFALLKSGQPGPVGPMGPAGKEGGIGMTGPAGTVDQALLISLQKEIAELKAMKVAVVEAPPSATPVQVVESSDLSTDDLLGQQGSGFKTQMGIPAAKVFSLKEVNDSEYGKVLLPNVAEKRGISVKKGTGMPRFEFVGCSLPTGYKPVLSSKTDNTGRNWVVFVK